MIIMDKEEFINVFILKSVLRDNRLTFLERLLLIHIISLCKKNGYCWATNRYFCDIYNVTQVTISKSISNLAPLVILRLNMIINVQIILSI